MMSIYWAWLLAATFTSLLGCGTFAFVDGYRKTKRNPDNEVGPIGYSVIGFIAGAVFFFLYLCATGAPVSNLDRYYISVSSFFYEGLCVPFLMPVAAVAVAAVFFVVVSIFVGVGGGLNLLGARTRGMVDRTVEMRQAMVALRDERARIKVLEHQPDLGDLGDRSYPQRLES